jgi:hypothetical protein
MEFKMLVARDGSGTATIDKQHLELDRLVDDDGLIKEADAHTQRIGERTRRLHTLFSRKRTSARLVTD